ncbi:MAG: exo-alpha-sialidase [Pirellulaceae bacterium]|nr:exo-alpha-sialidase [Pirellulaceae bacterium]
MMKLRFVALCLTVSCLAVGIGEWGISAAASPDKMRERQSGLQMDPRVEILPIDVRGWMVRRGDGSLLSVAENEARASRDDGKTWAALGKIVDDGAGPTNLKGLPAAHLLLKTRAGTIVLVYLDLADLRWKWDDKAGRATEAKLDVWAVRSLDDGKTWSNRQRLLDGYCGALIDIVETREGKIVVPLQRLLRNPDRHGVAAMVSSDQGLTWQESNLLDLGGHGHHDGAYEPTLAQLGDGRLLMILRTNHGCFYQAFSSNCGLHWESFGPGEIDASSSPGYLVRLSSGRLALVWNRKYPEGKTEAPQRSGPFSKQSASWQREELSLAFSDDDGRTWPKPVVIARNPGARLSYPYTFEVRPGVLWVNVGQGDVWMSLKESDFVETKN